jgi:hypothetical protein
MSRAEAEQVLGKLGEVREFTRHTDSPPGWVVHREVPIFVYCDQAGLVDALEFGTPGHGVVKGDRVLYDNIDIFATPVEDVLEELRARDLCLEVSEEGYSYTVSELLLAFWRDGGPRGADEMPLFSRVS